MKACALSASAHLRSAHHAESKNNKTALLRPKASNTASLSSQNQGSAAKRCPEFDDLADLLRDRRNVARAELVRLVGHFLAARAKSDSRDHRGKNDGTLHSQSPLESPVMGSTLNA